MPAVVGALLLSSILVVAPSAASAPADPGTCQGKPVTVTGNIGTDGDDVMVAVTGTGSVATGAGADLVCVRDGSQGSEPWYELDVDTGPGNDSVHNEVSALIRVTTVLGAGEDHYSGSDAQGETVIAGPSKWAEFPSLAEHYGAGNSSDTEADTISTGGGSDVIYSGSMTPGSDNPDVLDAGAGDDQVNWAGEQDGPSVVLGAGVNALSLHPGWQGAASIDASSGVASLDGRDVLRWTGEVRTWRLMLDTMSTAFTGTDADESLTVEHGVVIGKQPDLSRTIDMRGGNDVVDARTSAAGRLDGGTGQDRITTFCATAVIRVGVSYRCQEYGLPTVDHAGAFLGWEDVTVDSYGTVSITGTDRDDTVTASSEEVRMYGLGGDDRLSVEYFDDTSGPRATSVVRGGPGADTILGHSGHDRLLGGPGRDRLLGRHGKDTLLGGGGQDVLRGDVMADLLVGGTGRDRAAGGAGRDRCDAEVESRCER